MERVKALQAAGLIAWNGKKPPIRKPKVINTTNKLMSDLVVEMRQ
jgi:chromosome segregation and condensation protein ScpB